MITTQNDTILHEESTKSTEACFPTETARFTYTIYVYGMGTICPIGIVLNILNVYIFTKINRTQSLGLYLLRSLAFSDFALLVISYIAFPLRHMIARHEMADDYVFFQRADTQVLPYLYYPMHVPYYISIQVRNHIMVVIALDR
jgi:hypothetical protein